ncbi:P-loop NTPase fold protein [Chryseobacterium echinoideorum]|uniref:P-loop NTPase fold protein n=1 Tax=Chryseobacterium echinoideorum TaxID=1549648 RepID=UPI0011852FBB|nr:P-loop NTPase fold protein [Chryseobacterium echinoideorum]
MAENSTNQNSLKFLKNQPLGEDLFENKSQDKIAQVISEKIINDPEFKIIGIDGEWGSGKSNLVRLLDKKLESTHKFFVYDVWGHQEDEQRKSILVELTEFIKNEPNLLKQGDKKIWDNKLKVLLAKSKETTTINQPYLSIGFIFSLLSIVYIPTVNVFKDSIKDFLEIESWFWKIVLVTFPLIIVVGIYIWNVIGNWSQKNGFWNSFKLSAEETFQVYTNKQKEETKIETVSEDQPSVRDFQNWMNDINDDLNKKVVIVFDNFDRLPKKHILNIWSSIHIFFAEKSYSNIKIIIPFDREHIQNAFNELNGKENTKFGDDYVNKTFDIVFRITLPIMSNWKKFFTEQWKKAFTNYDEDELKLVVQVYEFLNRRITPREIISFINEILTIKLLDNSFKERYLAIFVLKKDDILKNPLDAITNLEYLKGLQSFYSNDKDFAKQLTAIVYHIDVENAIELIYTQELKDSMNKNDVEQFNTICKSEFIDSIFNSAITELEILENPILTLSKLDKETNLSKLHISQAWDLFYSKILKLDIVRKLEIENWQVTLLRNISDDTYLSKLLANYYTLIDDINIENYADLIDNISKDLGEDRINAALNEKTISASNFIKLIEYKSDDYEKYKLKTNFYQLDLYLSKLKIDEIFELEHTDILAKTTKFRQYQESLKTELNKFIDQNNIELANNTLIKIKETVKETSDLKNLLEDVKVYTIFANNTSSDLPIINELIAMRIAKGNTFSTSYKSTFNNVLNTEDEERASKIAQIILQYISYGELLLLSKTFENAPLFRQIILSMFPLTSVKKTANIIDLINKYQEIKESLKIDDNELITELNKWKINKNNLDVNKLDDEFLKDCIANLDFKITKDFLEVFNSDFKNFYKDTYETVFDDESDIHFKYFEYLELESLTQESLDVYENKFIELLKSSNTIDKQWWRILKKYDENNADLSVVNTLKNIRDQILNSSITLNLEVAKLILPYFLKYDLLSNQKDIFRLIIKNEFLSDSDFVKFLISNSDFAKNIYQQAPTTDKDGFRNTINEKRESNDLLEQLAKKIDIRKPKGNTENQ